MLMRIVRPGWAGTLSDGPVALTARSGRPRVEEIRLMQRPPLRRRAVVRLGQLKVPLSTIDGH
jgi:hypothetical protein